MSTALACLHGFKTLALSLQLESPVQWLAVDRIRVSVDGGALQWTQVHPAAAPESDPLTDVALSWSGAIAVRPGAPLPAESRDAAVRTCLSTIAQWEVLDPLSRREAICEAPDPPLWPAPFPWAAVAVASAFAHVGAPACCPKDSVPFGHSSPPSRRTPSPVALRCAPGDGGTPPWMGGGLVQAQSRCAPGPPRLGARYSVPVPRPNLPCVCVLSCSRGLPPLSDPRQLGPQTGRRRHAPKAEDQRT